MFWLHAALLAGALDIRSVEVVWQAAQDHFPAQGPARVRSDDDVTLSLLVHFTDGTCAVREGAWQDRQGEDHLCDRELAELRDLRVEWFHVVPSSLRVIRDARGVGPALSHVNRPWARAAPDRGLLVEGPSCPDAEDVLQTCGTLRIAARLEGTHGESLLFTPDSTDVTNAFVLHIRTDDTPPGVLRELHQVPQVDAPRGSPPERHETSLGLGVDGPSAVIHMARRMGVAVPFAGWSALQPHLVPVGTGKAALRAGDVLRAGAWTAVLREDFGKRGVLDPVDTVLVVEGGPLKTITVGELPAGMKLQAFRIKGMKDVLPPRRPRTGTRRKVVDARVDAGVR